MARSLKLKEQLERAETRERPGIVQRYIAGEVARLLRLSESRVDVHTPLLRLGFDSLMVLELRNRIHSVLGVDLSTATMNTYNRIDSLAAFLLDKLSMDQVVGHVLASPNTDVGDDVELLTI